MIRGPINSDRKQPIQRVKHVSFEAPAGVVTWRMPKTEGIDDPQESMFCWRAIAWRMMEGNFCKESARVVSVFSPLDSCRIAERHIRESICT